MKTGHTQSPDKDPLIWFLKQTAEQNSRPCGEITFSLRIKPNEMCEENQMETYIQSSYWRLDLQHLCD